MERINSETEKIASANNLEAKAKQPNTIYSKVVDNGFTLEYLVSAEAKKTVQTRIRTNCQRTKQIQKRPMSSSPCLAKIRRLQVEP